MARQLKIDGHPSKRKRKGKVRIYAKLIAGVPQTGVEIGGEYQE